MLLSIVLQPRFHMFVATKVSHLELLSRFQSPAAIRGTRRGGHLPLLEYFRRSACHLDTATSLQRSASATAHCELHARWMQSRMSASPQNVPSDTTSTSTELGSRPGDRSLARSFTQRGLVLERCNVQTSHLWHSEPNPHPTSCRPPGLVAWCARQDERGSENFSQRPSSALSLTKGTTPAKRWHAVVGPESCSRA